MRVLLLFITFSVTIGCAGFGGSGAGFWPTLTPTEAQVSQLATQEFEAAGIGATVQGVTWNLREGAAAGSISPHQSLGRYFATYTAPNQSGVFHLDATVTFSLPGGPSEVPISATITVP